MISLRDGAKSHARIRRVTVVSVISIFHYAPKSAAGASTLILLCTTFIHYFRPLGTSQLATASFRIRDFKDWFSASHVLISSSFCTSCNCNCLANCSLA